MNEPAKPVEVYAVFCAVIDQNSARGVLNQVALISQAQPAISHLHLLFQSNGGMVSDGICLYNFFKGIPVPFTIYNVGTLGSIAVIAYLGAKARKVSRHATFMIHRTTCQPQAATANVVESISTSLRIDDARAHAILREHLIITDAQWSDLRNHEFWFTAEDALKSGLATEIGEFSPPIGQRIYSFF